MTMMLLTGAGGTLGRALHRTLAGAGMEVLGWLHRPDPDIPSHLNTRAGDLVDFPHLLDPALPVEAIIHLASSRDLNQDDRVLEALFQVARRHRIQHLIYVSILGVDRSNYPYYTLKYHQELQLAASGLPYSIVRLSQFHPFVLERILRPLPLSPGQPWGIPEGLKFQSMDLSDAAHVLIRQLQHGPSYGILTWGGPQICTLEEMALSYLRHLGLPQDLTRVPGSSPLHEVFRTGINLTPQGLGHGTDWEHFLHNQDPVKLLQLHTEQSHL